MKREEIDMIYIITYDENLSKIWRVVEEMASIWLYTFEVINWINLKTIKYMEWNQIWKMVSYNNANGTYTQKLCDEFSKDQNSPSNCASMLSHKIAFEKAQKDWHQVVMMIEEDLLLNYKTKRYYDLILDTVPDDWDMLRLERNLVWNTSELVWNPELINNHWFKADIVWSAARMIFNKNAIDHIVEVMNDKPRPSFDRLTNMQCNNLNSYTSLRSMWIQYPL